MLLSVSLLGEATEAVRHQREYNVLSRPPCLIGAEWFRKNLNVVSSQSIAFEARIFNRLCYIYLYPFIFLEPLVFVEQSPRDRKESQPVTAIGDGGSAGGFYSQGIGNGVRADDNQCPFCFLGLHSVSEIEAGETHGFECQRETVPMAFVWIYLGAHQDDRVLEAI